MDVRASLSAHTVIITTHDACIYKRVQEVGNY